MSFSPVRVFPIRSARKSFVDPHEGLNIFSDKGKSQDLLIGSRLGKATTDFPKQHESSGLFGKENDSKQTRPESRGKGTPTDSAGLEKNRMSINLFQDTDDKKREVAPSVGRKRHSISGPVVQEAPRMQRKAPITEPVVQKEIAPSARRPSAHAHRSSFGSIGELFQPVPVSSAPSSSSSAALGSSGRASVSSAPATHRRLSSHPISTALPQGGKFEDTRNFDPSKKHVRRRSQILPINKNSVDYNILNPTPVEPTYRRQKAPAEPSHVRSRSTPPRQPSPARQPSPQVRRPSTSESSNPIAWHI